MQRHSKVLVQEPVLHSMVLVQVPEHSKVLELVHSKALEPVRNRSQLSSPYELLYVQRASRANVRTIRRCNQLRRHTMVLELEHSKALEPVLGTMVLLLRHNPLPNEVEPIARLLGHRIRRRR